MSISTFYLRPLTYISRISTAIPLRILLYKDNAKDAFRDAFLLTH